MTVLEPYMKSVRSYLGHTPKLGERVFIDPFALVLGQVELGDDCSVWPMAVVRGDMHHIKIGERTSVQDGAVLHITHDSDYNPGGFPLLIGSDVTIGHKAVLHGCTVRDRVLIGMGAIIMDGAVIGEDCVVGAGALVTEGVIVPPKSLILGSPAKVTRTVTDEELAWIRESAQNYVGYARRYLEEPLKARPGFRA